MKKQPTSTPSKIEQPHSWSTIASTSLRDKHKQSAMLQLSAEFLDPNIHIISFGQLYSTSASMHAFIVNTRSTTSASTTTNIPSRVAHFDVK
jgi:hypothetical protein